MNISFVTTRLFDTPRSGGELCTARLLHELVHAGHCVQVVGRGPQPALRRAAVRHDSVGPLVPAFETLSRTRQLRSLLSAWAAGQASTVHRLAAGAVPRQLQQLFAAAPPPDVLVLDHLQVWPWLAAAWPGLPAPVLVMHNLESDGYAEQAAAQRGLRQAVLLREARLLRRLEDSALRQAAVLACLSDEDAAQLRQRAGACGAATPIEVLPGFAAQTAAAATAASAGPLRRIGLIGTWTWGPNRTGLQWLLDQVLPLLPGHCRLVLAGAGLDGWRLPARTVSLGRVDDARRFYDTVDVVALASLQGSGVQEKAIEAVASGRTVVATQHALRGLGTALPANVHVADDPREFARLCAAADGGDGTSTAPSLRDWTGTRRQQYRDALARCLAHAAPQRLAPA